MGGNWGRLSLVFIRGRRRGGGHMGAPHGMGAQLGMGGALGGPPACDMNPTAMAGLTMGEASTIGSSMCSPIGSSGGMMGPMGGVPIVGSNAARKKRSVHG